IVISICIFSSFVCVSAQDQNAISFSIPGPAELSLIKMKGDAGITYVGSIVDRNQRELTILTDAGTKITVSLSSVQDIRVIPKSQIHDGEYWYPNPNDSRYLFAPSAFNLKKGEGYYQNTYLFINTFNYGITDNFSMGLGFEFISTFASLGASDFDPIYFLTPKYSTQVSENVRVGVGVLYGKVSDDIGGFGVGYGLVTYGNPEHNATLGLGFGFFDGEFSGEPVITLSGMTRLSRRISLVTENWFFPADVYRGIISYGIRFFGETMSVDLALVNNDEFSEVFPIGIPYVDFVVKF
ncbi:MAG: hypothetical protein ACO323_05740, partial [Candidatus Kapaibacteriota bacterium]